MEDGKFSQDDIIVNLVASATVNVSISAKSLVDLSIQHIQSAALYAKLCEEVESRYSPYIPNSLPSEELTKVVSEHSAHAISSIFASVAFLEGTINKFLADVFEQLQETVDKLFTNTLNNESNVTYQPLDRQTTQLLLVDMLKSGFAARDRNSICDKFNKALVSCGKNKFDKNDLIYKDAAQLVNLRNALVHYKPKWITLFGDTPLSDEVDDDLLEALRKKHLTRNPFISGPERQFFPIRCLSHAHAEWAVHASVKFADEFFNRIGLPHPYNHVRPS